MMYVVFRNRRGLSGMANQHTAIRVRSTSAKTSGSKPRSISRTAFPIRREIPELDGAMVFRLIQRSFLDGLSSPLSLRSQ